MRSLCCFWCPSNDYSPRALEDSCASCGRAFDTPLRLAPKAIGNYAIEEPISRGFYGAVYRALQESLKRTVVLKVVPVAMYETFGKNWTQECEEHAALADGTALIAQITDRFDEDVVFGDSTLRCHVAVLANIPGPTLEELLKSPASQGLTPRKAAQVAADLFEILNAFAQRNRFHNDLHAGNVIVQPLSGQAMRLGSIDPSVRAVAVDLGSVKDMSLSGDGPRLGDHTNVARQIAALADAVRTNDAEKSDVDYRIAGALRGLAEHLTPTAGAQRIMTTEDALRSIRFALSAADEPWRQPLSLARFGDAYNAQALESWHVPELWFDPEDRWLARTTARGPQVVTGMRGCGKTILLRALHFHARAQKHIRSEGAGDAQLEDAFVGVYASCQKLLNPQDQGNGDVRVPNPFARLFVAYLRDAVQVLRHLRSLSPTTLISSIDALLCDALKLLETPADFTEVSGERSFEQILTDLQFRLADTADGFRLRAAPAEAFSQLAALIRGASPVLAGKYVLFLLDDVSTRYLHADMVREVISQLMFQHPHCAFRITTEAQALHRVLLSPGGSAPADPNRDYEEFDLGNEVYRLLHEGSTFARMDFVSEILRRRGRKFSDPLYQRNPREVLGDLSLEQIAREIADSSPTSAARKKVYRGLRALQAVCVGDLGDVVKLYERILLRAEAARLPVDARTQTKCFLEHSASLLHFLNRRDQRKKNLALAFAQASSELLYRSGRDTATAGAHVRRLRQYTKLYVRVDAAQDSESVTNELLDLLDAGVFVYDGGVARTKTRDSDPVLQFKLSFRKMLGLASFIGLSDRDRFELSGDALSLWLSDPGQAKRILLDSESRSETSIEQAAPIGEAVQSVAANTSPMVSTGASSPSEQLEFLLSVTASKQDTQPRWPSLGLSVCTAGLDEWKGRTIDTLVLALGFEERAVESARRILTVLEPRRVLLVRYDDDQGGEIKRLVEERRLNTMMVTSRDELVAALPDPSADVVVDSSGLSKPFLFVAVREALRHTGRVGVVHTTAKHHYPRNEDLLKLGVTADQPVPSDVLERLGDVLTGEAGPYRLERVHHAEGAPDRWRALIASASPKNDRLLHLLDWRACDATRVLVPSTTTPRRRIALAAAELAASAADANVALVTVDTNDIEGALRATEELYGDLYFRSGANVEIGLTGSKTHAVAFAALAAAARVSAAWYVAPEAFDRQRFTEGVDVTRCFDLALNQPGAVNADGGR